MIYELRLVKLSITCFESINKAFNCKSRINGSIQDPVVIKFTLDSVVDNIYSANFAHVVHFDLLVMTLILSIGTIVPQDDIVISHIIFFIIYIN